MIKGLSITFLFTLTLPFWAAPDLPAPFVEIKSLLAASPQSLEEIARSYGRLAAWRKGQRQLPGNEAPLINSHLKHIAARLKQLGLPVEPLELYPSAPITLRFQLSVAENERQLLLLKQEVAALFREGRTPPKI